MTAGRKINSLSQGWNTPPKYVNVIKEFFNGCIELDPCSNRYSIVKAKIEFSLPEKDGLAEEWNYRTIYVNPPYGADRIRRTTIKHWLYKCAEANNKYNSEVLALVPVATNTLHWKNYIFGRADAICFLYDTRLKFFVNGKDEGKGAPMSCAIIYWGSNYVKFFETFIDYGAVVNIRNLHKLKIGKVDNIRKPTLFD